LARETTIDLFLVLAILGILAVAAYEFFKKGGLLTSASNLATNATSGQLTDAQKAQIAATETTQLEKAGAPPATAAAQSAADVAEATATQPTTYGQAAWATITNPIGTLETIF
jgi:hypothetical protein